MKILRFLVVGLALALTGCEHGGDDNAPVLTNTVDTASSDTPDTSGDSSSGGSSSQPSSDDGSSGGGSSEVTHHVTMKNTADVAVLWDANGNSKSTPAHSTGSLGYTGKLTLSVYDGVGNWSSITKPGGEDYNCKAAGIPGTRGVTVSW